MSMIYELWDTETRNRIAEFDSRREALVAVLDMLYSDGRELAETMFLGTEDEHGRGSIIARGAGLIDLALHEVSEEAAKAGR